MMPNSVTTATRLLPNPWGWVAVLSFYQLGLGTRFEQSRFLLSLHLLLVLSDVVNEGQTRRYYPMYTRSCDTSAAAKKELLFLGARWILPFLCLRFTASGRLCIFGSRHCGTNFFFFTAQNNVLPTEQRQVLLWRRCCFVCLLVCLSSFLFI